MGGLRDRAVHGDGISCPYESVFSGQTALCLYKGQPVCEAAAGIRKGGEVSDGQVKTDQQENGLPNGSDLVWGCRNLRRFD